MKKYLSLLLVLSSLSQAETFNVSTTAELRIALSTAASNDQDDTINLADGIYKTSDDDLGTFIYFSNERNTSLTLNGSSKKNVFLSGDNKHQIYSHEPIGGTKLFLNNLSFIDGRNMQGNGGAVYTNQQIKINNCNFFNNRAENGSGGGIYADTALEVANSNFRNNTSKIFGGGFRAIIDLKVENSVFVDNFASSGAGFYFAKNNSAYNAVIVDSSFTGNVAGYSGGGFLASGSQNLTVINSTFNNNTAGSDYEGSFDQANRGGGFNTGFSNTKIINSIFTSNTGSAISGKVQVLLNSLLLDNDYGVNLSNIAYLFANSIFNNLESDVRKYDHVGSTEPNRVAISHLKNNYIDLKKVLVPHFSSNNIHNDVSLNFSKRIDRNFRLTHSSDLIDAGMLDLSSDLIDLLILDIDNNDRISGNTIDIGPYEFDINTDSDDDGVSDMDDSYPYISLGSYIDNDSDGAPDTCDEACIELGMAADNDDDNDGVLDNADVYPLIAIGNLTDTDSDGAPDTCDEACVELGMAADTDDDNDGVVDTADAYPLVAISDLVDTDSDGAPDECDESCVALGMAADSDDDNDGVLDIADAFPNDSLESLDTDLDGVGNRKDYDDDDDGINDDVIYLTFNTTNNISGEFTNNSDITDILTNPDIIKGWLKINKSLVPENTRDTTYLNSVIAYEMQIGSYRIGPYENMSKNHNEIRVVYEGKTLDLYIWPEVTNELGGEQVEKISFRIDLPADFNYSPGQSLENVGELFERTNEINNSNSLSVWWASGRTGNLDVNYEFNENMSARLSDAYPLVAIGELTDTDSDGAPDTCNEACIELGMAADADDDNDGIVDTTDIYPLVAIGELTDTDSDGAPDACDEACVTLSMAADTDDDNDGVLDTTDAYPLIAIGELTDTDSDGAPDSCDAACVELGMAADTDDDNDGLSDNMEIQLGTNPTKPDSDGDSLSDLFEYESLSRNPLIPDYHLEIGWQTACFTDHKGIKCWGKNDFNLLNPPSVQNVSAISMSGIQACAISTKDGGVNCWGASDAPYPDGINIQDIVVGQYHTCTLKDFSVECLSSVGNYYGILDIPSEFPAPVMSLESGNTHICAILSTGAVKCWGSEGDNLSESRKNANQSPDTIFDSFDSGPYINCGSTGNSIECFGENAETIEKLEFGKAHIYDLAVLDAAMCVVNALGVKCEGAVNGSSIPSPSFVTSSSAVVAIGKTFACALDEMKIKCWGSDPNNDGVLVSPEVMLGDFDADGILDNIDIDDDNDGVLDTADTYPLIAIGDFTDTDGDGEPDDCDEACLALGMAADADDDNDGLTDEEELALGTSPVKLDTDGDGVNDNEDSSTVIVSSTFPSLNVTVIGSFNDISRGSFRLTSSANPNMLVIYPISIAGNKMEFEYKFPSNVVSGEYEISSVAMVRENDEVVQERNNYYFDLLNEKEEVSEFSIQDPHLTYDSKLGLVNVRFIVDGLIDGITRVWPIGTRESLNMDLGFIDGSDQRLKGRVLNREVLNGINGTNVLNFEYFIADEPLPETIYVRSIALTDKALNGVYHTIDTDGDNIIDVIDAYPFISVDGYSDINKNGAPETCDEGCTALGMTKEDIINPKYYLLKQDSFTFASLTPTAKVIVTGSQGDNFFDIARYVNEVSVVGQTFLFSGSSEVDGVMIQPGVKYDLTNLKGSIDKLYFSGPLSEYAESILLDTATGVMQLSRLTDIGEEIVQFIATNTAADLLVFTDGAISTADIKEAITSDTPLTDLTLDTTSKALDAKVTTGATVKHIVLDNNGAGVMALGPNISTLISGSSGVDQIYVPAGSNVDASNLKSSQDEIYLQGNLADYASEFDSSGNIVLSRDVVVEDETQSERVILASGGNAATNDLVIFTDQQLDTATLKQQVLN